MSARLTRSSSRKRRRDKPRASQTVLLGTIITVASVAALILMLRLYSGVPTTNYRTVYLSTPTVGNLLGHDFVRIGGKRVGQVIDIDVGDDGRPLVELQLDPELKLPKDTDFKVRANGLLGARYVQLTPGKADELLPQGATLEGDASAYTFGLPDAVDTFNRETRGALQGVVSELGEGLAANGRGLNQTVRLSAAHSAQFDQIMREIKARPGAARRLLPATSAAFAALDRGSDVADSFPDAASDAFTPFVTERAATHATLDRAPATLQTVGDGLGRGRALLSEVRRFATVASTEVLPDAPAGFAELSKLLSEARPPLRRAEPVLRNVETLAQSLGALLLNIDPLIPRAKKTIDLARPILKTVGDHGCDVVDAGVTLRSMTGFGQSGQGPNGKAMAFRLQAFVPNGLEVAGITDTTGLLQRDGLEPPCKYPQKEYPQFANPVPQLVPASRIRKGAR